MRKTGVIESRKIVNVFAHPPKPIYYVVTRSVVAGLDAIGTTVDHPFWVLGHGWMPANALRVGDVLVPSEGFPVVVERVEKTRNEWEVYNIEVEGFHTYFAGNHGVWVHNACTVEVESVFDATNRLLKYRN